MLEWGAEIRDALRRVPVRVLECHVNYLWYRMLFRVCGIIETRNMVADPYLFIWYGSGSSFSGRIPTVPDSGVLMTKNWKLYSWKKKKKILDQKLQFTYPYASYKTSKLQKKPSALKREHPALQNVKFLNFFYFWGSFLPCWIRFRIPNTGPDPLPRLNPDQIWIRIRIRNPAGNNSGKRNEERVS